MGNNLQGYIRTSHANSHGIHKGSATKVTLETTLPPPTSSIIAAQCEWSIRQILDIYWHFAKPGDHYLGRCLAGLDPSSEEKTMPFSPCISPLLILWKK
jgi:hypothetical protein